jgi:hypothetical protein
MAVVLALLGNVISFYSGAERGWFLKVAAISRCGFVHPENTLSSFGRTVVAARAQSYCQ